MDPNANLREQEEILHRDGGRESDADFARLWDLRQALYDWLREGGFAPDWSTAPNASAYYASYIEHHATNA